MSDILNPYVKTVWDPHIVEIDEYGNPVIGPDGKPVVITEGTRFTASRANNIENGIYILYAELAEQKRVNQRQDVRLALMDRSSSNDIFFDTMDGSKPIKMILDVAEADIVESVVSGTTILKVSNTNGFKTFTEVTVYDDLSYEDVIITAIDIDLKTITVQALTNNYKKGAKVARSNVLIDAANAEMGVGDWQTYNVELVEVV